jgi:flagellar basal-body rod protein FlgB
MAQTMDTQTPALLKALQTQMKWATTRQSVISQNIANADTPGYLAKDLERPDFKRVLKATTTSSLTQTNSMHLAAGREANGFATKKLKGGSMSISGNGVDLERENIEMAKTRDMHSLATSVYRKFTDMNRLALKGTAQ